MAKSSELLLPNVQIGFRNFSGAAGPYNKEGDRNFVVFLSQEKAQELSDEGWNVKWPKDNSDIDPEEDSRNPYLPVSLSMDPYPAKVVLVNGEKTERLEEDQVSMLDWAEIENVDLVVRPYTWAVNGNTGIKAYTKAIYVTIATDAFQQKYGI